MRGFRCNVVTINLSRARPQVIAAQGGIGRTEAFESMIRRTRAVAAINGSFFDAYNKTGDKDPGMTLIHNAQVIHKGMTGTVIGFGPRGTVMGRLDLPIRGTVQIGNARPASWYAYWINRTPQSQDNIALFTPARGARCRVSDGVCVVVEGERVARVVNGDAAIPPRGFVIHYRGNLVRQVEQFSIGRELKL